MNQIKKTIYKNKALSKTLIPAYLAVKRVRNFSSQNYWENRYKSGGNSGAGSYGRLADFKAEVLNDFVKKHKIKTVLELGSGDGNQLGLFKFPHYIGFDVSRTSIANCIDLYGKELDKSFFLYEPTCFNDKNDIFSVDMAMSLDVIYHLVEDEVFEKYMRDMFEMAQQYVVIYSSDLEDAALSRAQHVRHRQFTKWISKNLKGWKLEVQVDNKYSHKANLIDESPANFYFYKKVIK